MALPTDVQGWTPPQVTAAAVGGTQTSAVAVLDHKSTRIIWYFDGGGVHRANVVLASATLGANLNADFDVATILAAGEGPAMHHKRLHAAAKIALGVV